MKKLLLVLMIGLVGTVAVANDGPKNAPAFEERKKAMLARIDARAAQHAEHRACIAAATDRDGLKACRQKMKDARQSKRGERDDE